ncbi:homogenitisate phytyltransferase [Amycolatopsis balhimycina DSM 5908]|uniref:Homogenitisate phytyltransferase n=2 Tax=Amycolatopsis balhimycina TaxID=208443 RepID=A0A428WSW4_AMYBA|nr:homogenitisate phytyltransferase [Amycolatopsis balhimycina DSM 5908]
MPSGSFNFPSARSACTVLLRRLRLAWREARPVVQLIFLLRFAAGAALGVAGSVYGAVNRPALLLAALGWLATTWAVYLLNGVADVVEDRANGQARPIARGELSRRPAVAIVWALSVAALVFAAAVSSTQVLLTAAMLGVGWAYSLGPWPLKANLAGFVAAVTALGVLTYLAGWSAAGGGRVTEPVFLFGLMMSLWMGLGGSTKDLADAKGDRLAGRKTLPVLLGDRRARAVMAIAASAVGWTFAVLCAIRGNGILPAAVVVLAGSAALSGTVLTSSSRGSRSAQRRPYRVFMVTQYCAHLALFGCLGLTSPL